MKIMKKNILLALVMTGTAGLAHAQSGTALIYKGAGSCHEGCSEAAALMAQKAGFTPVYVMPNELDEAKFQSAKLWIQPGGDSVVAANTMRADLKKRIAKFVYDGGGYVGFCAGAFFATRYIGGLSVPGLGILPGRTMTYDKVGNKATMIDINWEGKVRNLYWNLGPRLILPASVPSVASYPDGTPAAARGEYGAGRVYVTGLHPEAPAAWKEYFHLTDTDGQDDALAVEMIRWAALQP